MNVFKNNYHNNNNNYNKEDSMKGERILLKKVKVLAEDK